MKHLAVALPLLLAACFPAKAPMRTSFHPGPAVDVDADGTLENPRTLVVLLPGFGSRDRAFETKGVVEALRAGGLQADLVAADATFGYYIRDQLKTRLGEDVIARYAPRYDDIWVLGISMGGVGALLTAHDFKTQIDGVVLLSPYLGRGRTLDAVRAGRRMADYAPADERAWDEDLWDWLKQLDGASEKLPPIVLGYGTKDLGMSNLEWFARYLPQDRVRTTPGGHTWETWTVLAERVAREELVAKHAAFGAPGRLPVAELPAERLVPPEPPADSPAGTEAAP
jgi:pimeloyl-ACP methyl ester carboxylesterase